MVSRASFAAALAASFWIGECDAWNFDVQKDAMGRGTVTQAFEESTNEVTFSFPYQGAQHATLVLRVHPKYGRDVVLKVRRGQFNCHLDGCRVTVRFDEGKPQTFSAVGPSDGGTTSIFLNGFDRFVSQVRKAKEVRIEAEFYQQGSHVFVFNVSGLGKWPM